MTPTLASPIGPVETAEISIRLHCYWAGVAALTVFVLAYALVFLGERAGLRKSKPVMLGAGIIWVLIAIAERGKPEAAVSARFRRWDPRDEAAAVAPRAGGESRCLVASGGATGNRCFATEASGG